MQKETNEPLMKERSYRASLSAGFRLYMSNFKRIFKSTWLVALLTSLVVGVTATVYFIYWPELIAKVYSDLPHAFLYADLYRNLLIIIGTTTLLAVMAYVIFEAYGLVLLHEHKQQGSINAVQKHLHWEGKMVWKALKATFFNILIYAVLFGLVFAFAYWRRDMFIAPSSNIVSLVAAGILLTLVCILLLPMVCVNMKYIMEDKASFWPLLAHYYLTSLRYWGYQFVIILVCYILLCVLIFITSMPEIILMQANWEAHIGVVGGDPLNMPGYMTALTYITCAVITFMQLYILLSALFPVYYMYGSIETRTESRKLRENI